MANDCLTRVVEEVLAMVRPMPAFRDRTIVFERKTPLYLMMNASQMKQVILNLVANALQATPSDGRVEVRLNEQVDWVVLEVEDDGCGMSSETLSHLFEPFYSTKQAGQGTGLGMSITHRIIENHHGTIEPVSPGEGHGSLFEFDCRCVRLSEWLRKVSHERVSLKVDEIAAGIDPKILFILGYLQPPSAGAVGVD